MTVALHVDVGLLGNGEGTGRINGYSYVEVAPGRVSTFLRCEPVVLGECIISSQIALLQNHVLDMATLLVCRRLGPSQWQYNVRGQRLPAESLRYA